MTDDWADEGLDVDRPNLGQRRAARADRRRAIPVDPHDRRRWPIVGVVALALALAGVSGAIKAGGASTMAVSSNVVASSVLPVVAPGAATSSAWYCPGPLPLTPRPGSLIEIANTSASPVMAQLTVSVVPAPPRTGQPQSVRQSPAGSTLTTALTVPPMATSEYVLPAGTAGSFAAVSVLTKGGGVSVAQRAIDQGVPTTAGCQEVPRGNWLLASGSTAHAADMLVSLFDPTSQPAVVNVSCAVPAPPGTLPQAITPAPLQGLTLQPGQLLVLDLGRILQLKPNLAVAVTSTSGRVVAGEWTQTAVGLTYYGRLQQAISAGLSTWSFPLAASPPGTMPVYWLFNPSTTPTKVEVSISVGTKNLTTEQVSVPPSALEIVSPSNVATPARQSSAGVPGTPAQPPDFAIISTVSGPPVVAARGYIVKPASAPKPAHGAKHGTSHGKKPPVATAAVYAPWTMLGTGAPQSSWLVFVPPALAGKAPAKGAKGSKGHKAQAAPAFKEDLYIANSGQVAASVVVTYLRSTGAGAPHVPARVTVQAGATLRVALVAAARGQAVLLRSSTPVTAEIDLYAPKLPSGDAAAGIPVA